MLVDELAHTNVPGSRHPKRWQDIDELLAAGIDVYTTLNVQHIESLNDVVGGITGITVWETVPDSFFDQADEVVLVDVSADDLLARLAAGKVYLPEHIERAAKNFFRKGNLMALRELALRRTADRVEDDVQAYRSDQSIERVWKTEDSLLCCIGPGPGSDDVVRSAARLASQLGVDWSAVYVETPGLQRLPAAERERILRTVKLAQEFGAQTVHTFRKRCSRGGRRIRPHAQLFEAGRWAQSRCIELAVGTRDGASDRGTRAGHRPNRGRARHRSNRRHGAISARKARTIHGAASSGGATSGRFWPVPRPRLSQRRCCPTSILRTLSCFLLTVVLVALKWGRGPRSPRSVRQRGRRSTSSSSRRVSPSL